MKEAARMLERGLENTEVRCDEDSIEAGHELLEDSDLQSGQEVGHDREGLCIAFKKAEKIFALRTGKPHKTVKEIELKIKYLS